MSKNFIVRGRLTIETAMKFKFDHDRINIVPLPLIFEKLPQSALLLLRQRNFTLRTGLGEDVLAELPVEPDPVQRFRLQRFLPGDLADELVALSFGGSDVSLATDDAAERFMLVTLDVFE